MRKMGKTQYLNYLAIDVLDKMGITNPSQMEIDFVESSLARLNNTLHKRSGLCERGMSKNFMEAQINCL